MGKFVVYQILSSLAIFLAGEVYIYRINLGFSLGYLSSTLFVLAGVLTIAIPIFILTLMIEEFLALGTAMLTTLKAYLFGLGPILILNDLNIPVLISSSIVGYLIIVHLGLRLANQSKKAKLLILIMLALQFIAVELVAFIITLGAAGG